MKKIFFVLIVWVMSMPLFAESIIIGTGGVTGMYYPTGSAICELVNEYKKDTKIRCSVESTSGSIYNVKNIKNGKLDFAIVQSDVAYQAYYGQNRFEGKPTQKLRSVMSVYLELLTLIVNKKSNIKSLKDTRGKVINIGNIGSGDEFVATILYEDSKGINLSDLSYVGRLRTSKAPIAMRDGKIDGYFFMVGHPTNNIKDTSSSMDTDIIAFKGDVIDRLIDKYPYYSKGIIQGGIYKGIDKDVSSFGVKAVLVTSEDTPNEVVESVIEAMIDNFDTFKNFHPLYSKLTKKSLLKGVSIPLHEGAKSHYKSVGLLK